MLPVFSRSGRPDRSTRRIITGSRVCQVGSPWPDFRSSWECRDLVTRRQPVLSLRRSQARRGLPLSPSLRFLRLGLIRLQHLRPRLRLFRHQLRVLIRLRILPRPSPFKTHHPSVICRQGRLTLQIVAPTVILRRSRPLAPSTLQERAIRQVAGPHTAGDAVLLHAHGIVHVHRAHDLPPKWRLPTSLAVDSQVS